MTDPRNHIERALDRALTFATATKRPPLICDAIKHAVFAGGARVRPRLCLAVADACGNPNPAAASSAATAIELLHCASLVHDDLPCFDNADLRRGKPSVQAAFGEPLAVLVGDALIVLAFETIARECATTPDRIAPLIATVARSVGMPHGIVAGQAFESEPEIPLAEYHRTKTAALFVGATASGAIAADSDPQPWMAVGEALGAAYQVADDLRDKVAELDEIGKPCYQDAANGRPNAVDELGVSGTLVRLRSLVEEAVAKVPDCAGSDGLKALIAGEAKRLVPKAAAQAAA